MTDMLKNLYAKAKYIVYAFFNLSKIKKIRTPSRGKEVEETGQWYFKNAILDRLDEYFVCIKRMKKTDPSGFRQYSRFGAMMVTDRHTDSTKISRLSPRWKKRKTQIGFGAVAFMGQEKTIALNTEERMYWIKFAYFQRLEKVPPTVEPARGDTYEVTVFITNVNAQEKWAKSSQVFYVAIHRGKIKPLRFVEKRKQIIKHKRRTKADGKNSTTILYHPHLTYGSYLEDDYLSPEWGKMSIKKRAERIFCIIAEGYEGASAALRVTATRGPLTAVFGVDLLRTPYFFDDRDPVYGDHGQKMRIFHIVRTHKRERSDGSVGFVRSHFRGLRKFKWGSCVVRITMPGTHHKDLLDANIGQHIYEKDEKTPRGLISHKGFIDRIVDHLSQ